MSLGPQKERERQAARILRHIAENWQRPLDWSFKVEYVPPIPAATRSEEGYRITAAKGSAAVRTTIGGKRLASYWTLDQEIEKLEIKAANL